jgi:hypothetical protein
VPRHRSQVETLLHRSQDYGLEISGSESDSFIEIIASVKPMSWHLRPSPCSDDYQPDFAISDTVIQGAVSIQAGFDQAEAPVDPTDLTR